MKTILALVTIALFGSLFVLAFVLPLTGLHYVTGEGEHVGYVTAVERHGLVWKTWTAYVKTDAQSSQEDRYCVVDQRVVDSLKAAAEDKSLVKLSYFSWFAAGFSNCANESDVIGDVKAL